MKKCAWVVCIALLSFCVVSQALADKCKDPIVDEVSAFSDADREAIGVAMNKLVVRGADVRVQMLSSYHNVNSIDEYKKMFQEKCSSWKSPDGGMKNNLILLLVVPKKQATGVYAGEQWRRHLESGKTAVFTDMNARFRDGKLVDGILVGLRDIDNLMSVDLANAKKPVVINNSTPTDMSGLWRVFGWLLLLGTVGAGVWFFMHIRGRREQSSAAQRTAMTERAKCTQATNGYTTPLVLLKSKIASATFDQQWKDLLSAKCIDVEVAFKAASAAFNGLNKSANNPETPGLSVQEYEGMTLHYRSVSGKFDLAQSELSELESELKKAQSGKPFPAAKEPHEKAHVSETPKHHAEPDVSGREPNVGHRTEDVRQPSASGGYGSHGSTHHHQPHRRDDVDRGGDTTIIVMSEDRHIDHPSWADQRSRHQDNPVIVEPENTRHGSPSQGDGISGNWGESGQGDSVSGEWGKSGQGDSVSGSWNQPDQETGGSARNTDDESSRGESLWSGSGTSY